MEKIFINKENSKTIESHKFVLHLSQRLDSKNTNKHVALQNLSIYDTWKNLKQHYKNDKIKITAPTWNDEFELPAGSYLVSGIQDYISHIIKKHETLTANPLIHFYIHEINNRLVSKIIDIYKVESQTLETVKLLGSTEKTIDKRQNGENIPSLEVVEEVLAQCNLADNQYQQNYEVLYTFTPNKSYTYLVNVEPSDLVFLKTSNTEFDNKIITFN